MGYSRETGDRRWADVDNIEAVASAARTVDGNAVVEIADRGTARVDLSVTAHDRTTGDETLDVDVETGSTDTGPWTNVGSFTQVAAQAMPHSERVLAGPIDRYVRVVWTFAGTTPSSTFAVDIEAA